MFVRGLAEFARKCDCLLWEPEGGKVIEPDSEILLAAIRGSGAYRFVSGPAGFFRSIKLPGSLEEEDERVS